MKPELKELGENIWLLEQPFKLLGAEIGTRTTVIQLSDQSLWIHSPGPSIPGVYKKLRQIGDVKYLVAPNPFHHLFIPKAMVSFPEAIAYGPKSVQKKHPNLTLTRLENLTPQEWSDEIEMMNLDGLKLGERVFFHPKSKTLMMTDLLFNMKGHDLPTKIMLNLEGVNGKLGCTRLVSKLLVKDKNRIRKVCEKILEWDFERMIMCHGEVVEVDAKIGFAKAMEWTGLSIPKIFL